MTSRPEAAVAHVDWDATTGETIELLRDLIRIPSVNPPQPDLPDGELRAARFIAHALAEAGIPAEIHEPVPGRGSVTARLRGDGSGGDGLLLLSHVDVVPAPDEGWTHDPFAGDVADGYVWGRGAVDMKAMVAMEVAVLRLLASRARAAGRDPASDPIPGLRRDVLFASTADEEAGGQAGAGWLGAHRPDTLRAAGALNECGGVSLELAGRRLYPIQVAEKGFVVYRITVRGTWGHGSMPRDDNAAVRAAHAVTRLASPGEPRMTGPMRRLLAELATVVPPHQRALVDALGGDDSRRADAALRALCDPMLERATRALLRDTISPDIIRSGVKYNVIPGEATLEIDCRILPGTTEGDIREEVLTRLGDLAEHCEVELVVAGMPVETSPDTPLFELLASTVRAHDPDGVPVPVMAPFSTDAKHTATVGTPTYGFSPLRTDPGERFLERFHGVDERVGVAAIHWGLPVLYDVVTSFCRDGDPG